MEENSSTELSPELEALADKVDQPRNSSVPMVEEVTSETPQKTPEESFEFTHNGKPVKATRDQILKWAQQGYDYPQKLQKLNQERSQWNQEKSQWETKFKVYQDIDSWAAQNPSQWQRLEQLWKSGAITQSQAMASAQAQSQGMPANDPYASRFQHLESQLGQVGQFVNQLVQERTQIQSQQEDNALDQAIQSIRDKHKDLDWENLDESGKSLEVKVLEHARNLGISDGAKAFKLAFQDLFHDQIVENAAAQAKINLSKGIQQKSKLGVLGESPTSRLKTFQQPRDIKTTSYEQLAREALEELRAGSG